MGEHCPHVKSYRSVATKWLIHSVVSSSGDTSALCLGRVPISHVGVLSLYLEIRIMPLPWKGVALLYTTICIASDYLNSSQLLMGMSPAERPQKALMNASARRALVSKGILRSTAARRILYPLVSSPAVRFLGKFTTISISLRLIRLMRRMVST